jgi:hypothetical protein
MALAPPQVIQGRTGGGASRSGGLHFRPDRHYGEAETNWCTRLTAPSLGRAMQAAGVRESSIAGEHWQRSATKHGDESGPQHSKHHGEVGRSGQPGESGERRQCIQNQPFTGPGRTDRPWPDPLGLTAGASPRALDHIGIDLPPGPDNRADRICLGPGPPGACTHGVIVELLCLRLSTPKTRTSIGWHLPVLPGGTGMRSMPNWAASWATSTVMWQGAWSMTTAILARWAKRGSSRIQPNA